MSAWTPDHPDQNLPYAVGRLDRENHELVTWNGVTRFYSCGVQDAQVNNLEKDISQWHSHWMGAEDGHKIAAENASKLNAILRNLGPYLQSNQ